MSPSMTSTHRLTSAMKRRRVIRGLGASEIGTEGEGERQPAQEGARLRRQVRGGTAAARQLLVLVIRELSGEGWVPWPHTIDWREALGVGSMVGEGGSRRSL